MAEAVTGDGGGGGDGVVVLMAGGKAKQCTERKDDSG